MKRYKIENVLRYNEKANILNVWIHIQINGKKRILSTSFDLNDFRITIDVIRTFINLHYRALKDGKNWEECEKLINKIPYIINNIY